MTLVEPTVGVIDAILARHSVRQFRADPVSPELLRQVLEVARRSPSWANTQPWEVAVITGQRLEEVKNALGAKFEARIAQNTDVPWPRFPAHVHERSRENGLRLYGTLGIAREDRAMQDRYNLGMQRFFEAPVGMIFCMHRELPVWSMLDLGLFMQTVMLSAIGHGLGTCVMAAAARYPDVLRDLLQIENTKQIVCGIGVGYEDADAMVNEFRSNRMPLDDFVRWYQ